MPRGGCCGRSVIGCVSNGVTEEVFVVGDGVNVDVGLYFEHVGDEAAVWVMLKKSAEGHRGGVRR